MSKRPVPPKSELEVADRMGTWWSDGTPGIGRTADGAWARFQDRANLSAALEAKGYLKTEREGRSNVYRPIIRPGQVIGEVMDDLLNRLFDGQVLPLFQHLVNDRGLSDNEIHQLRELLDRLEKESP